MVAVLVTAALGGVSIAAAVVARHRAQAAADLAALSAAVRVVAGAGVACGEARAVAATMHAALRGCDVDQLDVVVSVAVAVAGRGGREAVATARAGPADNPG
jgi:secretion/DNA translocation related TadE-like protein